MRKHVLAAMFLPLLLVGPAACSTSADRGGVASANGSTAPSATPSVSQLEQGIRYAQCLRQHGVPMPDPVADGDGIRFATLDKDAVDQDTATRADEACKQYRPVLGAADSSQKLEPLRGYARCMRAHGVENFPDPDSSGHFQLPPQQTDPDYDQARATCNAQGREPSASPDATR